MAKHKKHIDDFFKDHLNDSSLPLSGGEWDAIAKELHPKKKRFIWWIWLIPAIIVGAATLYFSGLIDENPSNSTSLSKHSELAINNNLENNTSEESIGDLPKTNQYEDFVTEDAAQISNVTASNSNSRLDQNNASPIKQTLKPIIGNNPSTQGTVDRKDEVRNQKYNELQDLILSAKQNVEFDLSNVYSFNAIQLEGED
ncbi:MAG: hypothetical protein KJP21_07430, partial [Bacteroidia bacterium]|nr:hypothetical protein [Bacteroidia bacterium]